MNINKQKMLDTLEEVSTSAWERVGNVEPGAEGHKGALEEATKATELYLKVAESMENYDLKVDEACRAEIAENHKVELENKKLKNNTWTNVANFAVPTMASVGLGLVVIGLDLSNTMTTSIGRSVANKVWDVLKLAHGNLRV